MSPIFKSPMADFGYDISDFKMIDPLFGTEDDFVALLARAKQLDIKVILDFVPNHSSDEHEWFQKSLLKEEPYTDYYNWQDGKVAEDGTRSPPNNWQAGFNSGSAWTWREERQQYYLHQFDPKQPDLNYNNPAVVDEMKNVLRFWLDKGVDGFRVDAISTLFENQPYDEVPDDQMGPDQHLDATYDMVQQWRVVIDEYSETQSKIFMLETYGTYDQVVRYYGTAEKPGGHIPFNFKFISDLNSGSNANNFVSIINEYLGRTDASDPLKTPNWVIGNHDNHRVGTRYGEELIDAMNMLVMLLPGIGVTYNGEEIGMVDTYITWEQCQDPQGVNAGPDHYLEATRDVERTPFQWDVTTNSGFSSAPTTWLPVNENYNTLNLATEKTDAKSHYKVYKSLDELRKTPTLQQGATKAEALSDNVFAFSRTLEGADTYVVVINLGSEYEAVDLNAKFGLSELITVQTSCIHCSLDPGVQVPSTATLVMPKSGMVYIDRAA